nr:Mu transposase C-terminal domain-containing protein [Rhodoferax sp.]
MLTEEQIVDLCDKHNLSQFAVATIRNVRSSDPSRNVHSGTRNVATHFASRKMGCVVKAEARSTELSTLFAWEHDPSVHEFYDQPPTIKKIRVDGKGRERSSMYTPDFFVLADDFIGWVECKEERWLLSQAADTAPDYIRDENGCWRCPSAERYAETTGLGFRVRSSAESDPIVTQNLSDLSDYFRTDCPGATASDLELVQKLMGEFGWCWLRDLLQNKEGPKADAIYKMIVDDQVAVDLGVVTIMNEPHRVRIFRTQALLLSSHLWLPEMTAPALPAPAPVARKCGTQLLWDGKAYALVNVGETQVCLRTADDQLVEMGCDAFERLVGSGQIVGAEGMEDPRHKEAGTLLLQASAEDVVSAMHRYYCLHPELCPSGETHQATDRAIRAWRALVRDRGTELGNEFTCLLPNIRDRGNRNDRFGPKVRELMRIVVEEEIMGPKRVGYFVAWSILTAKCEAAGVVTPSRRTFGAEVARLKVPVDLKAAREGEKAAYGIELPYLSLDRATPKHGCRPFDLAHIDHTLLDLQFVDENFGRSMKKAWLTVLIDAYTRVILAWVVLFDEPSYRSCMLVIRDCVQRHHRFPQTVVADQGSEFKCKYFETLIAYLGSHKRMRPASKPRFGSIIERFFGKNNTEFVHALAGNNQALQSPRSMSPSHNPVSLSIWNLRAFREAFEGFLTSCYHSVEHPMLGVSPGMAMEIGMQQSGARTHTLIPYTRDFVIATMPAGKDETAKIQQNSSFKVNRQEYYSPTLAQHVGKKLDVKYDPFDISHAFVQAAEGGWIEAFCGYADQLKGRSEKEIAAISVEVSELSSREGIREKDRARALGEYFESIRSREASLALETQAARDREQRQTYAESGLMDAPAEPSVDTDAAVEGSTNVVHLHSGAVQKKSLQDMQRAVFEAGTDTEFGDFV